jgi:hypothetical protein
MLGKMYAEVVQVVKEFWMQAPKNSYDGIFGSDLKN